MGGRGRARGPAVPQPAGAGMQPSLANARSVAGRTAAAWTGEPSLEDVLAPVQNRKRPTAQRLSAVLTCRAYPVAGANRAVRPVPGR